MTKKRPRLRPSPAKRRKLDEIFADIRQRHQRLRANAQQMIVVGASILAEPTATPRQRAQARQIIAIGTAILAEPAARKSKGNGND